MDSPIRMLDLDEQHADFYRLLQKDEAEKWIAMRQRKQAIATGAFEFLHYFLWDHQNERPEVLRHWIENAEQLIAVTEQVLNRKVAGSERKAFREVAKLDPESVLEDIRRIWNEIFLSKKVVYLDTARRRKQAVISDDADLQQYYSREHRKEHPSMLRYWAKNASQLIETTEKALGRPLDGRERKSFCELATIDPESVHEIQRMFEECGLKH